MGGGSVMSEELKDRAKLYKKLQQARVELQSAKLKKTGYNPFQKFNYFELGDFLPHINKIFNEIGLSDHFNIYRDRALAECLIIDSETGCQTAFYSPIQEQLLKQQDIGAVITYARRYAYNIALNISENDILDAQDVNKVEQNYKMQAQAKNSGLTPKTPERNKIIQTLNMNVEFAKVKGWLEQNNIKASKYEDLNDNQLMQVWNLVNNGGNK